MALARWSSSKSRRNQILLKCGISTPLFPQRECFVVTSHNAARRPSISSNNGSYLSYIGGPLFYLVDEVCKSVINSVNIVSFLRTITVFARPHCHQCSPHELDCACTAHLVCASDLAPWRQRPSHCSRHRRQCLCPPYRPSRVPPASA